MAAGHASKTLPNGSGSVKSKTAGRGRRLPPFGTEVRELYPQNGTALQDLDPLETPKGGSTALNWWPKQDHRTNSVKPFKINIKVA